jgi:hypothetical protein
MTALKTANRNYLERHSRTILAAWWVFLLLIIYAAAELFLRWVVPYHIDYYTGVKLSNRMVKYPFGDMPFNSYGYPDRDWNISDPREHVGFLGDSITMGFGAGYGYRFSEFVREARNDKYYMNFGGAGEDGIATSKTINTVLALVDRFNLSKVVYAMNLNDILPDQDSGYARKTALHLAKSWASKSIDWLRGKSYVYNYFRTKVKLVATRLGYGYHGDEAYELYPYRNRTIVKQTADRINRLWAELKRRNIQFCVVVFPYEMQISADAAETYRRYGIRWAPELLEGEPQRLLRRDLAPDIPFVDLHSAFTLSGENSIRTGQFFVYNRGDALDWNHPNRDGHRLITSYLLDSAADCL